LYAVKQLTAFLQGDVSECVEVQEICAFDQAVAIAQPWGGHVDGVDRPQADRQQKPLGADSPWGEP